MAEQQNDCFAQYLLGKVYLNGESTEQALPQAEMLFEKAAAQGNRDGQRMTTDKKLRQKIEEKKQAHGLKMG